MLVLLVKHFFRDVYKLQSVVNYDYDFCVLPAAEDVHYNFETEKKILSCLFYVSFAGETFIF